MSRERDVLLEEIPQKLNDDKEKEGDGEKTETCTVLQLHVCKEVLPKAWLKALLLKLQCPAHGMLEGEG